MCPSNWGNSVGRSVSEPVKATLKGGHWWLSREWPSDRNEFSCLPGDSYKGLRDCNFLSLEFLPVHLGNRYLDRYSAGAILGMEGNRRLFYYFYSTRRKKESVERSRENSTKVEALISLRIVIVVVIVAVLVLIGIVSLGFSIAFVSIGIETTTDSLVGLDSASAGRGGV